MNVNTQGYKDPLYMQKWRAANKERRRVYQRAWYEKHRVQEIASATRRIVENYDRYLIGCRACHATQRYPGRLTRADVTAIFDRDQRVCYWCGKVGLSGRMLTIDHLQPVNDVQHIVTACLPCNASRIALGPHKTAEELRVVRNEGQRRRRALQRGR